MVKLETAAQVAAETAATETAAAGAAAAPRVRVRARPWVVQKKQMEGRGVRRRRMVVVRRMVVDGHSLPMAEP